MSGFPPPRGAPGANPIAPWMFLPDRYQEPLTHPGYHDPTFDQRADAVEKQRTDERQRADESGLSAWQPGQPAAAGGAPAQGLEVQARQFSVPAAVFSPELMKGPPREPFAREKWYEQAAKEVNDYFLNAEVLYMQHMASEGEMRTYLQDRAQEDATFKTGQQAEMMGQSIPWTNVRDPAALQKWTETAGRLGAVPGFEDQSLRLRAQMGDYAGFVKQLDVDRAEMGKLAKGSVRGEADRWGAFTPLRAAVHQMNPLNIAKSFGDPRSRILADLYDEVGRRTGAFEEKRRSTTYEGIPSPEKYREHLTAAGLSAAMGEMKTADVSESGLEEFGRHAGDVLGFLAGGAGVKGAARAVGYGAKAAAGVKAGVDAAEGAGKLMRAAKWFAKSPRLIEAGAILGAGYAGGLSAEQKARFLEIEGLSEEDRARAETSGRAANALMGYLMFPVMHMAGAVGRKLTMGAFDTKATRFLEPALALPILGEAQEKGFQGARGWLAGQLGEDDDLKKDLDLMLLSHPEAAGPIERIWKATTLDEARAAAMDYGKAVLPAAASLGAWAALSVAMPNAISREMKRMTSKDADAFTAGDKVQAEVIKDEVNASSTAATEPTAEEQLVERVGPENAGEAMRTARAEEVGTEGEARRKGLEPDAAKLAAAETDDALELGAMAEKASSTEDAKALVELASQKFARAAAIERGEAPPPMQRPSDAIHSLVRSMVEDPAQREATAQRLLAGGLERQAAAQRARAYNDEAAAVAAGAKRPAPVPEVGDTVAEGEVTAVQGDLVDLKDVKGRPVRRTTQELAQGALPLKPGKTSRQKGLERQAKEGNGLSLVMLHGGLTPEFAREFTGLGAKDLKRPGLVSKGGIRSIDHLARVLDEYHLIEPKRTGEPEVNRREQAEQWLLDAVAGKKAVLDADSVVAEAAREREAIQAEHELEAQTARKVRPRDAGERQQAEEEQTATLKRQTATAARKDAARRAQAHEDDPVGTPPPGESEMPAGMRETVALAEAIRGSGVLKGMGEAKDLAGVAAPRDATAKEFLAFAKARGKASVAQHLYEFLHARATGRMPAEKLASLTKRLRAELDAIAQLPPARRPAAVRDFLDRNITHLHGPAVIAMRLHSLPTVNKIEALLALDAGETGGVAVPSVGAAVGATIRTMRALWPWSTPEGLQGFSYSPLAQARLIEGLSEIILRDPSAEVGSIKTALFRALGIEHPETWAGVVAHDMAIASNEVITQSRNLLRSLIDKKYGMLREIVGKDGAASRERLFDALDKGPKSPEWDKLDAKEKTWATTIRAMLNDFRRKLAASSPYRYHLRREQELAGHQARAHEAAAANAPNPGLAAFHVERAKAYDKRSTAITQEIDRYEKDWGLREFVHHVRQEEQVTLEHFQRTDWMSGEKLHSAPGQVMVGPMKRRTGALEASGELNRDIVASLVDYIPKAISYTHRNAVFGKYHEFLYGKQMPAEWADIATPDRDTVYSHRGRDYMAFGEVHVGKDGALSTEAGKDTTRRILLMDWPDRQSTFIRSGPKPTLQQAQKAIGRDVSNFRDIALELAARADKKGNAAFDRMLREEIPVDGNFRLVSPRDLIDITVRKGGWFGRASKQRANDMTDLLDRFAGGMRNLQLSPFAIGNVMAKVGRLASYLKLTLNVPAASNAMFSAMFMNSMSQAPRQLGESTLAAVEFYGRYHRHKNQPLDVKAMAAESGYAFGRAAMRSDAGTLKGLQGKALTERLLRDEAYETLYKHPLFEAKFADLARRMFTAPDKGPQGKAADMLRAMLGRGPRSQGQQFWELQNKFTGMEPMAAADHFGRTVGYLGAFFALRRAGKSRTEANRIATANVVRDHGIFNSVTRSRLIGSSFGQFAFGLQTYIMRQFDIWTKLPWDYKVRYASLALGSNYLWRQLGWGDLTNQTGFSAYDIPIIGQALEIAALGRDDEEPKSLAGRIARDMLRPGAIPVPLGVQGGPGMGAIGASINAIANLAQGRPVSRDLVRGLQALLEPAILGQWQRAFGTRRSDAGWEYTPYLSEMAGNERASYTLQQNGVMQYINELRPGTQHEVHKEIETRRADEAIKKRVAGRREAISEEARGVLRRYDDAGKAGMLNPTLKEQSVAKWKELSKKAKDFGMDLSEKRDEMRAQTRTEHLPPSMRAVLQPGTSKEAKVKLMTRLVNEGISKDQLGMLAAEVRGENSLMDWALDGESVSYETRKAFHAAMTKWRATSR